MFFAMFSFLRWNRKNRRTVRYICKSQFMFWLIITLVFLNTIIQVAIIKNCFFINADDKRIHFQATEHHHQPEWLDDFQEYTNLIFLSLFTLEMLMKMYAMSFSVRQYLYSVCNETRHPFSRRATWSPSSIDSTSLLSAAPS